MIDMQDAFRITGWMIPAWHAFIAVPTQHAKSPNRANISGFFR